MKIECPETESTIDISECNCGPKCEHYYDTKQHRIDELETAMQEFNDYWSVPPLNVKNAWKGIEKWKTEFERRLQK